MKKNNKVNRVVILSTIGLVFLVALVIFILNFTKDSSSFSILEKSWINNHSNSVIDISVYNDVPVYGISGEGIIFSYLDKFTNSYNIEFNKVSYLTSTTQNLNQVAFRILDYNTALGNNDILMYEDHYVIVSKDNVGIDSYNDLDDKNVGVLDGDISSVRYFLGNDGKIKYTAGKDIDELLNLIKSGEIDYIVIPQNLYLDDILSNELLIVFHINELYNKYVLTINGDNTLKSIMNKFMMIYHKNYEKEDYLEYYLNAFFRYKNISEVEKMNYNATNYVYGYVANMPYENMINKEFVGTFSNYLSKFEDMAKVEFKLVGYNNVGELKQAFSRGEVDLLFGNFNPDGVNVDILETVSPVKEDYVIISMDNYPMNSIRSLKGMEVLTVNNTYMYDYLNKAGVKVKGYNNTDDLLRNIGTDSKVMLNLETYEYYKDKKFKNYKIIYQDTIDEEYRFLVRDVNKNKTFYELYNYFVSNINYKDIKYDYNTDYIVNSKNQISVMFKYLIIIVIVVVLILSVLGFLFRRKSKKESINKDNKLKFIDSMTSLKNRNYLNYNIKSWDENVIYPQTIIIIDLNNIKYINDNYGHVEGDEVIKKAASILIVNQEKNTDIIRTDGNEFLIYMVGYDEKAVIEYTRRLSKELKDLPHGFGATLGYSMITDDVKTIDDAINEATLSMRQAKEKL